MNMDDDAIFAAADLVGRAGAKEFQVGYLHDDVPVEEAGWYAHAQYRGARIGVEDHRGPVEAVEALARRLLDGAECRCGRLVALSDAGAMVYPGAYRPDGTVMTPERVAELAERGQCRWTRKGRHWVGACGAGEQPQPSRGPNRAERRRRDRDRRRR